MARRGGHERASHAPWCALATLMLLVGSPSLAQAQAVNNCEPNQYLDRTAPNASRQLTWDFGITTAPERCMQVRTGQTVVWNGDLDIHPLSGSGGDTPNPITFHQNGSVTFNSVGTFGFQCLSHSPMKGAIQVVQAPPVAAPAPALSAWLATALTALLLIGGLVLIRKRGTAARLAG